jgi:cytochrome bd-type quinol oxidase subunit 1
LLARRWAKTLGVLFAVGAVYAWMNDLRGFTITRGRLTGVDPWAAMFNPATLQATTISAGVGIVLLVPSLAWLFRLFQHEQRS